MNANRPVNTLSDADKKLKEMERWIDDVKIFLAHVQMCGDLTHVKIAEGLLLECPFKD